LAKNIIEDHFMKRVNPLNLFHSDLFSEEAWFTYFYLFLF